MTQKQRDAIVEKIKRNAALTKKEIELIKHDTNSGDLCTQQKTK